MPTAAINKHWDRVRRERCMISRLPDPTIHHCKSGSMTKIIGLHGTGKKVSDWLVIGLNARYHTGDLGIDGGLGVETWERWYGTQVELIDRLSLLLGYNIWHRADIDRSIIIRRKIINESGSFHVVTSECLL